VAEGRSLLVIGTTAHTLTGEPSAGPGPHAVLIEGDLIAAVGTAAELRARAHRAEVLELPGTTVTPGLTDAHVHLTEWAAGRSQAQLSDAASPEAAAILAAQHAARSPGNGWVQGRGWDPQRWGEREPHRRLLDARLGERPVALQSHDMHALWVSSAALRAAGIDAATSDPAGGRIERDAAGQPTGLLLERAGELVIGVIPLPAESDVVAAVRAAQPVLHAFGITGVHSMPGITLPEPEAHVVLGRLHRAGELRLRILQHIRQQLLESAIDAGVRSGAGSEWIRTGSVKLFLDGALGSRTAWMRRPYENSDAFGVRVLPESTFRAIVRRAASAGIATTVHAVDDAAVALALDVLSDPGCRVAALPHRIEHVQCLPPERVADAARAGISLAVAPDPDARGRPPLGAGTGEVELRVRLARARRSRTGVRLGRARRADRSSPRSVRGRAAPGPGWRARARLVPGRADHARRRPRLTGLAGRPARRARGRMAPGAVADLVAWDQTARLRAARLLGLRPLPRSYR
jgi:predicted amidohydrolase YtcJ